MSTLAELNSRVLFGFADLPPEYLPLQDVHRATVQRNSVRVSLARMSDVQVLLSVTASFSPTDAPYDVTALIGKGEPSFVELSVEGEWTRIKIVDFDELLNFKDAEEQVCAFYFNEGDSKRYVQFAFNPETTARIWYDKAQVAGLTTDTVILPSHIEELVVLEAQNSLIPKIKMRIVTNKNRKQQTTEDVKWLMSALDSLQMQNLMEIPNLETLWKVWAFRDKNAQNNEQARRPVPSGRRLYGE